MKGQSIILVAVALLGLGAAVALAVDGGRLYAVKAQVQTAADAGALAGAREMCDCMSCAVKRAKAEAERYARLNEAQEVGVKVKGQAVAVEASITVRPFFAGMLGFRAFTISAGATATCGRLVE